MKKRPDGRYKVSLTIDGKRHYFYGRTIKEAEQRRNKYKNTLHSAPNIDYNITLGQWLSIWLRGAKPTLATDTYESYVYQLRQYVLPTMAKIKLIDLQPHMFRKLIADLLALGYSNRSVQYALAVVRIGLNQAVNDGVLPISPMRGVKLPQKQKTQVSALSKNEAQRLLGVISNPCHYNLYYVALHTGLRRSEILGLRIRDVNTKASTISVNQTVLIVGGKPIISATTKNALPGVPFPLMPRRCLFCGDKSCGRSKTEWPHQTMKITGYCSADAMDVRMIRNISVIRPINMESRQAST